MLDLFLLGIKYSTKRRLGKIKPKKNSKLMKKVYGKK